VSQSRQVDRGARRPAPPPKEADDRLVTAVGTVGWAVALVVLLVVRSALPEGARWWLWTCTAGLVMGLFALWYVPFLKSKRARAAARHAVVSLEDELPAQGAPAPRTPRPPGAGPVKGQDIGPAGPEPGYSSRESDSNTVSSTDTPGSSTRS
jgi:hypothetical protein